MLPVSSSAGSLISITRGTTNVSSSTQTIKGMQYAVFAATAGSYQAKYGAGGGFLDCWYADRQRRSFGDRETYRDLVSDRDRRFCGSLFDHRPGKRNLYGDSDQDRYDLHASQPKRYG